MPCGVWDIQGGLRSRTKSLRGSHGPADGVQAKRLQRTSNICKYLCVGNRLEPLLKHSYLPSILPIAFLLLACFGVFGFQSPIFHVRWLDICQYRYEFSVTNYKEEIKTIFTWNAFIRGPVNGWFMPLKITPFLVLTTSPCFPSQIKPKEWKAVEEW